MTYKDLLKHLQSLTSEQLEGEVVIALRCGPDHMSLYVTDVGHGKADDYIVDGEVLHVGQFYLEVG